MFSRTVRPGAGAARSARPLACAVVAGPLFIAVWAVQAFTREAYDPTYHPISLLSLGELGWIQITNFVVTGILYVAGAVGIRQVLRGGRSGTWGPLLVGALGVGLIMSGVFVTDPGAGFPPGAPPGAPVHVSWHGILHEIGFAVPRCRGWPPAVCSYADSLTSETGHGSERALRSR